MPETTEIDTRSIGDLITEGMAPVRRRYFAAVNAIAEEACELHPDDEDARSDCVGEAVDGDEWVIYYYNSRAVALITDNLDAYEEIESSLASLGPDPDTVRAFYAMLADVNDAIARRDS
jgi:hypothetical protein